jgi:hypothetical protein
MNQTGDGHDRRSRRGEAGGRFLMPARGDPTRLPRRYNSELTDSQAFCEQINNTYGRFARIYDLGVKALTI